MQTSRLVPRCAKVVAPLFTFGALFAYVIWKHRELSGPATGSNESVPPPASVATMDGSQSPQPPTGSLPVTDSDPAQLSLSTTKSGTFVVSPQQVQSMTFGDGGELPAKLKTASEARTPQQILHLTGTKSGAVSITPSPSTPALHMGSTKSTVTVVSPQLLQTVVNPAPDPSKDKPAPLMMSSTKSIQTPIFSTRKMTTPATGTPPPPPTGTGTAATTTALPLMMPSTKSVQISTQPVTTPPVAPDQNTAKPGTADAIQK
jgi:hypothetical protein